MLRYCANLSATVSVAFTGEKCPAICSLKIGFSTRIIDAIAGNKGGFRAHSRFC